jgi:hypothetical protein
VRPFWAECTVFYMGKSWISLSKVRCTPCGYSFSQTWWFPISPSYKPSCIMMHFQKQKFCEKVVREIPNSFWLTPCCYHSNTPICISLKFCPAEFAFVNNIQQHLISLPEHLKSMKDLESFRNAFGIFYFWMNFLIQFSTAL